MISQKLSRIASALTSIDGLKVYHYWRASTEIPYCIWMETGETSIQANNHKAEQGIVGAIELFTRTEFDSYVDSIQSALNEVENLYWEYDGADYEDETNLIHHSWVWRLL